MKTMIPAVAGTYLMVPVILRGEGDDPSSYDVDRVPILGWTNYSADPKDPADLRTTATPIVPFWPEGVSQAAGYLIPDERGGVTISVPFAKLAFTGSKALESYEEFAEELLRRMEEERNQEDSISGEMAARRDIEEGPAGDVLGYTPANGFTVSVDLPSGTYRVTPAEDTREVGATLTGNSRRSKDEIAADETFLEIVKGLGKTIRAVNTRWKATPSRTAVLRDLAGMKDGPEEHAPETVADDDDEDLIG